MAVAVFAAGFSISTAFAQVQLPARGSGSLPLPDRPSLGGTGEPINSNTVAIVSANFNAADDGDNVRVLPLIGNGRGQNIRVSATGREEPRGAESK